MSEWFKDWQKATFGPHDGDGVDEALESGTCICGQVLDPDALRCDTCGQCPGCSSMLGKADDPVCELCVEFLRLEQRAAVAS